MIKSRIAAVKPSSGHLLFILVLVTLAQVCEVASATTTVKAGSISVNPGGTGNVPITVNDITAYSGLGAYGLKVTFNPSVVEVLEVTGSASFSDSVTANIDNTAGRVTFNSFQPNIPGPTGSITIAYLKVKAAGSAGSSSVLIISYIDLADTNGNPISATPVHGSVTIKAPKSSSSITLSLDRGEVRVDESVTVSGIISPAHAKSVTLTFTRPDETRVLETTNSGSDGAYTYLFEPDVAGAWKVSSSWRGDANHYGASSSTAKFLVTKLDSSISVLASPMVLEPEGSLRIEGFVSPERDGATIKLEYRPHESEWTELAEVSTNSTGRFTFDWDIELGPGEYDLRASWLGDHMFEGAESSPVIFYIAEDSSLSMSLSSHSTGLDGIMVARGKVSPLHPYVNVTVSIEAPNGTALTMTVQTDAAGNYKVSFIPDTVGVWRFESSWPGDFNTHGSESLPVEIQVISTGSTMSLEANAPSITKGSQITFSGNIEPSPSKTAVMLTLTRPDSSLVKLQTESGADGIFFLDYAPDQPGVWLAQASWLGSSEYGGATSRPVSFTVERFPSTLSLSLDPPIPRRSDLVTLEGTLDPSVSSGSVEVLVSEDGGKTWSTIASSTTQSVGRYSASWRADKLGTFFLKAVWKGDEGHAGCASHVIKVIIQEEVVSIGIPLADGYETQVISSTNSSTSVLSVDSADGRIDVEVTGPNSTRGSVNILIPDSLLDSHNRTIDDVVFSVDGTLVTPEIVVIAGGYLATITYDHSERTISVHYLTHSIAVAVADYEGEVVVGADVYLDGPICASGVTNGSGSVLFPSMPSGNYTLQVYYGGKVAEDSLELAEDKVLSVNTVVGKMEAEYGELVMEYGELEQRYLELQRSLGTTQTMMYLSIAAVVALTSVYLAIEGQDQVGYVIRRSCGIWNDISARFCPVRLRLRLKRRLRKGGTSA